MGQQNFSFMGKVCSSVQLLQRKQKNYISAPPSRLQVNKPFTKQKIEIAQQDSYIDEIQIDSIKLYKVQQREMNQKLHKNVVAIIWREKQSHMDQVGRGSGLLISKNLVLTSAHNFYNKKKRVNDSCFDIYPGQYGQLKKPYKIDKVFIPPQFHSKRLARFDYALVKLNEKVNNYDFISLKSDVQKNAQALSIFGYPSSKYENTCKQQNIQSVAQWGLIKEGAIAAIEQNGCQILHKVSTSPGHSGSAIIEITGKQMYVVGIHKGGKQVMQNDEKIQINAGVRLTKELIVVLRSAAMEMEAEKFSEVGEQKKQNENGKESFQSWLIRGRELYMVGKYEQAVECLQKVIRLDKSNDLAYFLLGNSYLKLKNIHQAIQSFRKTIEINPKDSQAYYNLGNAFLEIKDIQSSIQSYKQAIKANSSNFQAYYNLGKVYQLRNKLLQAIQNYSMAVRLKNYDFEAWVSLGNAYKKTKKYEKAIESFVKATLIDPSSAEAFNSLGSAYQDNRQYNLAIGCFLKAISLKSNYQNAYYNLAIAYEGINKMEEAINAYKNAIKINPKYHIAHNNLGLAYFNTGQRQEAIKSFKAAIEIKPDYSPAYYNLGEALEKINNPKQALFYFEKYIQLNPEDNEAIHKILELKKSK